MEIRKFGNEECGIVNEKRSILDLRRMLTNLEELEDVGVLGGSAAGDDDELAHLLNIRP